MKFLKISFAALIAVATLGITLTSNAGMIGKSFAKAAIPNDCYRSIQVSAGTYVTSDDNPIVPQCIAWNAPQAPTIGVTGTAPATNLNSLNGLTVIAGTTSVDPSADCDPEFQPFCCFDVVNDKVESICFGTYNQ